MTARAQREMILPSLIPIVIPVVVGLLSYQALADTQSADQIIHKVMQHIPAPEKPLETHVRVAAKP